MGQFEHKVWPFSKGSRTGDRDSGFVVKAWVIKKQNNGYFAILREAGLLLTVGSGEKHSASLVWMLQMGLQGCSGPS